MAESRQFDQETIYELLPAVYRVRDALQGEPLKALMGIIASEVSILEEDLAQLYDDQFIETCAEWVIPYIGDLIGAQALQDFFSLSRAQIANTLAYRRRKGTAAVLEQLARDVTEWDARVVEFFQYLSTTQHLKHLRPNLRMPDLRTQNLVKPEQPQHEQQPIFWINTSFDSWPHTVDVRNISSGCGRYNLPNVGIFLWRLSDYSWSNVVPYSVDSRRFLFNPLGINTTLFTLPETEKTITHLAEPINVSMPISYRVLDAYLDDYYGPDKSIVVSVDGTLVSTNNIIVCNLADHGPGWAHHPADKIAIDPVLGRLAFPLNAPAPDPMNVRVSHHYGFAADIGGGEYERDLAGAPTVNAPPTVADGMIALGNWDGIIELDGITFNQALPTLTLAAGQKVTLRSSSQQRAYLRFPSECIVEGGPDAELILDGLLISGGGIRVRGGVSVVTISHCTLVPGIALDISGNPQSTNPSLVIETVGARVNITNSILGGIRTQFDGQVALENSIIDAGAPDGVAYVGLSEPGPGAALTINNCTIIGKVHTVCIELASNTIFDAHLSAADTWAFPVWADQRQTGCVRFSYIPLEAQAPRRYHCVPAEESVAGRVLPVFTARRYGQPGYCQLGIHCPTEISRGADDESEMGVFHNLFSPQRIQNLLLRLNEYLRFGLEAGIFFVT